MEEDEEEDENEEEDEDEEEKDEEDEEDGEDEEDEEDEEGEANGQENEDRLILATSTRHAPNLAAHLSFAIIEAEVSRDKYFVNKTDHLFIMAREKWQKLAHCAKEDFAV